MFGRAPSTSVVILALCFGCEWKMTVMDAAALQQQVKIVLEAQTLLHKKAAKVEQNREQQREVARWG